jgi:tetrapyrrole methylase family protein/MazG family protein
MSNDPSASFARLFSIIQRLRAPDGCPWDREQTPQTLRGSLIDEAWECVSAIDARDDANMEEELGDIYLLVTMMAWMKEQEGAFTVSSSLEAISEKLIRRHPHVFGSARASTPDEVHAQWDRIKAEERKGPASGGTSAGAGAPAASVLDRVGRSLPPLERSVELQKKAAKVGFDWPDPAPVWEKIDEEAAELREALASGRPEHAEEELGDLLFSVVNLARLLKIDPAVALNRTNVKFERRFRNVETRLHAEGVRPAEAGLQRMDALWNEIKAQEAEGPGGMQSSSK